MENQPKRKRGRPPEDKTRVMRCIRVFPEEWEAYERAAGEQTVSEWIRSVLNRAARRRQGK